MKDRLLGYIEGIREKEDDLRNAKGILNAFKEKNDKEITEYLSELPPHEAMSIIESVVRELFKRHVDTSIDCADVHPNTNELIALQQVLSYSSSFPTEMFNRITVVPDRRHGEPCQPTPYDDKPTDFPK